jgi:hypothetical protein
MSIIDLVVLPDLINLPKSWRGSWCPTVSSASLSNGRTINLSVISRLNKSEMASRPSSRVLQSLRSAPGPSRVIIKSRRTWVPYLVSLTIASGAVYFVQQDRDSQSAISSLSPPYSLTFARSASSQQPQRSLPHPQRLRRTPRSPAEIKTQWLPRSVKPTHRLPHRTDEKQRTPRRPSPSHSPSLSSPPPPQYRSSASACAKSRSSG